MTINELENLIDSDGASIYAFCLHLTGNKDEAEELYQETFLKALEKLEKISASQNPKSYILGISVKLHKSRSRKAAKRHDIAAMQSLEAIREGGLLSGSAEEDTKGSDPESRVLKTELNSMLSEYIAELKPIYSLPLLLYYAADLSIAEVAKALKLPIGSVKRRIHQARKILKHRLEEIGYDG